MLEMSSSGLGQQPKQKSINVDVNLLAEWVENRGRVREQTLRVALLLALILIAAGLSLPALWKLHSSAVVKADLNSARLTQLNSQLVVLRREKEASKPRLDDDAMRTIVRRQARVFIGQTNYVLNSATAGLAFESISAEVVGGEITIRCKAETEDESLQASFLEKAGGGPGLLSSLLSNSRRSDKLGRNGVAFEYVKRVGVSP